MNRTTTFFIAGALTGAALTVAGALTFQTAAVKSFYETIPYPPAMGHRALGEVDANLVQAIEKAERETEGRAFFAYFDFDAEPPTVTVRTYTENQMHVVVVNAEACEVASKETASPYPGEPVEGEWTQTTSGLRYFDIEQGDGPQPEGRASTVTVHYSGWTIDGRMFDSSRQRGVPAQFPLGQVIPGWTEGVGSMRVGGKRKLVIPGNLAYGPGGNPRAGIAPNATLVFDVELIEVREPAQQPGGDQ